MKAIFLTIALVVLSGCALQPAQISANPLPAITSPTVVVDLQSAAFNLDQAVAVGALTKDDPAPACLHDVLVKAGIEVPAGSAAPVSFSPKYDGVASAGAVAYILTQQAKAMQKKGLTFDVSCEALVGRVVIDGATAVNKALLPSIPGLLLK